MSNFIVVLFKNKKRQKIINKFITYKRAKTYYDNLIEENSNVIFETKVKNTIPCIYELALIEKGVSGGDNIHFIKDEYGRQKTIELDSYDHKIHFIKPYKKEELIFDVAENQHLSVNELKKKYIPRVGLKLISKINNRIVIQNDDKVSLFSLKNEDEASRFIDVLGEHFSKNNRFDVILVKDTSKEQKKYLYSLLESYGFSKTVLYRTCTTYKKR